MQAVLVRWRGLTVAALLGLALILRSVPRPVRLGALVLLTIAPVLILVAIRVQADIDEQNDTLQDRATQLAQMAASEQEGLVVKVRVVLETLAHVPAVRTARSPECHTLLGAIADQDSTLSALWVLGLDGVPLCSSLGLRLPASVKANDRPYFQQAVQSRGFVLSGFMIGCHHMQPLLIAALPIIGTGGEVETVLAATIDLPQLGQALDIAQWQATRFDSIPALLMVDGTGIILSWRSPQQTPTMPSAAIGQLFMGVLATDLSGLVQATGPDGITRLWSYAKVPGTGAHILVGYTTADAVARGGRLLWALALVVLAGGLAAVVARWRLLRTVTHGARMLAAAARVIGLGDRQPLQRASPQQIGSLTDLDAALADMVARLAERDAALRESEGFLRSILGASTDCIIVLDASGVVRFINEQGLRLLGLADASQLLGQSWAGFWPEAEQAKVRTAIVATMVEDLPQRFEGFCPTLAGTPRWWDVMIAPMPSSNGMIRLVAVSRDVTERRKAEEQQALLIREVDHRAKNALAVALSLVRLAPRDDANKFAAGVEGRIAAMARAHSLLAKGRWHGADLRTLAEGELAAHTGRVTFAGPPARLAADAAQPIAMLLHELATNAAKYGALALPEGRLDLSWDFGGAEGALRLRWTERGGPSLEGAPTRRGFGSRLLSSLAERQLGGKLDFDWSPTGLRLSLE
ncbi:MAG: PAS domain S-box protein [Pseudomonas sp.]|uniref:HWE histidine kinase domain-containing protein n=1 Tax=Pseudomonas sp. TaxID=306 RepID=UPI0011FF64E6|nr:HWE histidine kinase domain-containing protein [Pseudomonas sp.]RZI71327.1 MAG: PAS domain S-box protein [Pseudomonas sp.]